MWIAHSRNLIYWIDLAAYTEFGPLVTVITDPSRPFLSWPEYLMSRGFRYVPGLL